MYEVEIWCNDLYFDEVTPPKNLNLNGDSQVGKQRCVQMLCLSFPCV